MHSWGPKPPLQITELRASIRDHGDLHGARTFRVDLSHRPPFRNALVMQKSPRRFCEHLAGDPTRSVAVFANEQTNRSQFYLLTRLLITSRLRQGLGATAATKRVWLAAQPAGGGAARTVGGYGLALCH
jgi:hypothetical protein